MRGKKAPFPLSDGAQKHQTGTHLSLLGTHGCSARLLGAELRQWEPEGQSPQKPGLRSHGCMGSLGVYMGATVPRRCQWLEDLHASALEVVTAAVPAGGIFSDLGFSGLSE